MFKSPMNKDKKYNPLIIKSSKSKTLNENIYSLAFGLNLVLKNKQN